MIKAILSCVLFGVVGIWLLVAPTCRAGSPVPCKDTEHPNEPPCNMDSCRRMTGGGNTCSHYCTKGKGCCFCPKKNCDTMGGAGSAPEERPEAK